MKITINSRTLADALSAVSKAVDAKASLGILRDILIGTNESKLVVTGGNDDAMVTIEIDTISVEEKGSIAVEAFKFTDAIKCLPDQPIKVETTDNGSIVRVDYQQGHFSMPIESASLYPAMFDIHRSENVNHIRIAGKDFSRILNYSLPMTGMDMLRPVMSGVYFDIKEEGVNIVASDGHVLVRTTVKGACAPTAGLDMPKKAVNLLRTLVTEEDCQISYDDKVGEAKSGNIRLVFRQIEGKYPNYNSVIPKSNVLNCEVSRQQLTSVIRRLKPFASDSSDLIVMDFNDCKCTLEATDFDFCRAANETMEVSLDKPLRIGFKAENILSALNCHDSETIVLHFCDPSRPMTITALNEEDISVLSMCMPMLIQDYEK